MLKYGGWIVAAILAFLLIRSSCDDPCGIRIGITRQDIVLTNLPASWTNRPGEILDMVNMYRTNNGWIALTNDRIYAGLVDRVWSAPIVRVPQWRHEITLWIASGIGATYQYQLFDHFSIGGGVFYVDDAVAVMAGVGYRFE